MRYLPQPETRIFSLAVLFLCLLTACPVQAADQFLDTCLQIAEARDKRLLVAQDQLKLAQLRVIRSGRGFFPFVMAQRRFARGKVAGVTSQARPVAVDEQYESEEFGVKASQIIYEGGRQRATYRYDTLVEESARYNYTKTREELFYRIKLAYFEYLTLKVEYTALTKAFAEIEKLFNKIKIEYNAKAIAELELVEAENFHDKLRDLLKSAELNLTLSEKKLCALAGLESIDSVPVLMPEGLVEDVPEISFTLKDCLGFTTMNNIDLKSARLARQMAAQKQIISRSKIVPKFYVEGFYGQSGEAFVTEPLRLASAWSLTGRMSWSLWGNSLEIINSQDKTNPSELIDPSSRTENNSYELRLALLDDLNYFVEDKESAIGARQATAEYEDILKKNLLDCEKAYGDYDNSLRSARTLKNEINLRTRKLELLRKRNELYEVPTVSVMEESWKFGETIAAYGKALFTNYAAVAELERLTLMPLR